MRPVPEPVEELNKQFWAHCANESLCFQQCTACGKWRHLPRPMCAACGSSAWEWKESSRRGKIFSWTVTRAPFHPAFAAQVPYVVLVVEMEEGVRLVAGLKNHSVDDIRMDRPVEVIFERLSEKVALPVFQLVSVSLQRN
jgi:uncharacterized protein